MSHTSTTAFRSPVAANDGTTFVPEYLTSQQVASLTGFSLKALEAMRYKRTGPPYFKVGPKVRYRADDVRAWVERGGRVS